MIGGREFESGNVFIRPNELAKVGDFTGDHKHNFDHTTVVLQGSVKVLARTEDGEFLWEKEFVAPDYFLVLADVRHLITALEDDTVFWCVYSHRTPQGEVVQKSTGFEKAYR